VLIHSSNQAPSGDCDLSRSETNRDYLTRFGAASNRPSPLSPFFAFTDDARTPPEELVNPASAIGIFRPRLKRGRANQPGSTFPQSPGIILETFNRSLLTAADHLSSFTGLVAGPSSVLCCRRAELSSEAFQLAWAGGCATGLRTRSRHACETNRVSTT
jgi:hypothetical protein